MYATTISSSIALGIIFFILIFKWKILKQLLQDDTVNPDVKNKSFSLSRMKSLFYILIIIPFFSFAQLELLLEHLSQAGSLIPTKLVIPISKPDTRMEKAKVG